MYKKLFLFLINKAFLIFTIDVESEDDSFIINLKDEKQNKYRFRFRKSNY